MTAVLRPAQEADLDAAAEVVRGSIIDLRRRHGYEPTMPPLPTHFPRLCMSADPRGLWIAEEGSMIVGFGFSWAVTDFWFLAQLFIRPEHQKSRIGQALLSKTLEQAEQSSATNRALITFAYNPESIGLYVKHGLYPRIPLYRWAKEEPPVLPPTAPALQYQCVPMQQVRTTQWIDEIDAEVLGFQRLQHHAYLQKLHPDGALQISKSGNPVGYAYIAPNGHIGPLAMRSSESIGDALEAMVAFAAQRQLRRLSVIIPGPDEGASVAASALGLRIVEPLLLMASRSFGSGKYCPRDPSYM